MSIRGVMHRLGIAFTEAELAEALVDYVGPQPPDDVMEEYWRSVWKVLIGRKARRVGNLWCYADGGPIPGVDPAETPPERPRYRDPDPAYTEIPTAYMHDGGTDAGADVEEF